MARLEDRQAWDVQYADYLAELDTKKPVIACGDFNILMEIDLAFTQKIIIFRLVLPMKRAGFTNLLNRGFTDTFRHIMATLKVSILVGTTSENK